MKKGSLAAIAVVVVLGLLGLGWWLIRDRGEKAGPDEAVVHAPTLTPQQRADAVRKAIETHRRWWREASYVEIRQAAMDGDRVAQRRLSEVYEDCRTYAGPLSSNLQILVQLSGADPASKPTIAMIFDEFRRLCVQADADMRKSPDLAAYWLHRSAKAGDLTAQMRYVARTNTRVSVGKMRYFVEELRNSGDPDAMFEMTSLAPRMIDDWPDPAQATAFEGAIGQHAWTLAACRAGYDCARGSRMMNMLCVSIFACDQPDFPTYQRINRERAIDPAKVEATIRIINGAVMNPAVPLPSGG